MQNNPSLKPFVGTVASVVPLAIVVGALAVSFPGTLYLTGDDFGYADNLLRTYWAGRYTPADWLAPANFTLACLGSAILHLTGRFWLATLGVSLFSAFGLVAAAVAFFRAVGIDRNRAFLGGGLLLAHPILFGVELTYTGFPLYLLLEVSAAWAWSKGRLVPVLLLAIAATLTRQSGIALFVLALSVPFSQGGGTSLRSFVVRRVVPTACGVLVSLVILALLPKGWAGKAYGTTSKILGELSVKAVFRNIGIVVVCWGQATALGQFLSRRARIHLARRNLVIGGCIAIALLIASFCHLVEIGPLYHVNWPRKLSMIWQASLLSFLLIDYSRLRFTLSSLWGLVAGALVLVKVTIFDFYVLDVFIAFLFTAAAEKPEDSVAKRLSGRGISVGAIAVGGATILLAIVDGYTSLVLRWATEADIVLFETAQRAKQIPVTESSMSFGLAGWKLLDKYIANEEHNLKKNCESCFLGYISYARYMVVPDNAYHAAVGSGEVLREVASVDVRHIFRKRFHLVDSKHPVENGAPHLELAEPHPKFRRHPLNNQEWDALVRRGSYDSD